MTIIRSKVSQNFTIINNSVIHDKEFDSQYLGTFLRLISKDPEWEISVNGLAKIYSTNGPDYYRSALKHMCKLGYLIRIPQPRLNGQFQKVVMELYDFRQIDEPLSDDDVDKLFSKEDLSPREIQKIYPKRNFQHGGTHEAETTQQRIEKSSSSKIKEYNNKPCGAGAVSFETAIRSQEGSKPPPAPPDPHKCTPIYSCLIDLDFQVSQKQWITENYSEDKVIKAVQYATSPNITITTSLIQTIKWACREQPEIPMSSDPEEVRSFNREQVKRVFKGVEDGELKTFNNVPIRYSICRNYIEFVFGPMKTRVFDFVEKTCLQQIKSLIKEIFPGELPRFA